MIERRILQILAVSDVDPLVAVTVWRTDGGWWYAAHEPIRHVALVQRVDLDGDVETTIEPVVYDERSITGHALLSEIREWIEGDVPETVAVVPRDRVTWESLIELCYRADDEFATRCDVAERGWDALSERGWDEP